MPEKLVLIVAKKEGRRIASALNIISENSLYGRYWGAIEYIPSLHFELCYYVGQEFCIQNKLKYFEGGAQGEHKLAVGLMRLRHTQVILLQILNLKLLLKVFLGKEKNIWRFIPMSLKRGHLSKVSENYLA